MYASITEKSNDTEDPVLLFATLAVAEAKSAPSSGSFAIRSKSVATRCVRTSELEAHHSITFKARCGNCDDDAVFWRIFSCQYASNTREAFLMSLSNGTANVFDTRQRMRSSIVQLQSTRYRQLPWATVYTPLVRYTESSRTTRSRLDASRRQ